MFIIGYNKLIYLVSFKWTFGCKLGTMKNIFTHFGIFNYFIK